MRASARRWVDWAALAVGMGAVVASIAATSTRVGEGLTFGFAAFIVFFALLSLLMKNRTPDHWGLAVVGLGMFILPWLGEGFVSDRGAAWTAWVAGFLAMVLGAAGWLTGSPPTESGIRLYGGREMKPTAIAGWLSRAALVAGIVAVVLAATVVDASPAAVAVITGLGGLTAVIAVWSLLPHTRLPNSRGCGFCVVTFTMGRRFRRRGRGVDGLDFRLYRHRARCSWISAG